VRERCVSTRPAPESQAWAAELQLDSAIVSGSIELLERLFAGSWQTDDIVVLNPGQAAAMHHILCVW
jgi:hypothetical protein